MLFLPALLGATLALDRGTPTSLSRATDPIPATSDNAEEHPAPPAESHHDAPAAPAADLDGGFMFGASVGVVAPLQIPETFPTLGPGPTLGLTAGFRWRFLYVGAAYQHAFYGGGTPTNEDSETTTQASSDYVGVDFVTLSDPDATVAFFTHVGAGYRFLHATTTVTLDSSSSAATYSNFDVTFLGLGVQIKARFARIVPEVSLSVGPAAGYASLALTTYFDVGGLGH